MSDTEQKAPASAPDAPASPDHPATPAGAGPATPTDPSAPPASSGPADPAAAEDQPQGGTSVVGFILIPLILVIIAVGIAWTFMVLAEDRRTVQDYAVQIRSENKSERWQAVLDLVSSNRGSPDLIPILIEMVESSPEEQELIRTGWDTTDLLKTPEERRLNLRWYATAALGNIGGPQAEEKLVELLTDPDGGVRLYAVHGLARTGKSSFIPLIVERLRHDEDPGVRAVAAYSLGEIADPQAEPALRDAFETDPETDVQWNAAIALARFGDQDVRPMLEAMIDQGNPQVRTQARKAIKLLDRALVSGTPAAPPAAANP